MKTWEKIQLLDEQYVEARKQLALKQCDRVEIIIHKEQPKEKVKKVEKRAESL